MTGQAITAPRPTKERITFGKQPEVFLTKLEEILAEWQLAHRTQLSIPEQRLWIETLKGYSLDQIQAAKEHLSRFPPKQQLSDGTVQSWRGMPQIQDVTETISKLPQIQAQRAEEISQTHEWRRNPECQKCDEHGFQYVSNTRELLPPNPIPKAGTYRMRKCDCISLQPKASQLPALPPPAPDPEVIDELKRKINEVVAKAKPQPEVPGWNSLQQAAKSARFSTYAPTDAEPRIVARYVNAKPLTEEELSAKKVEAEKLAERFKQRA